MAGFEKCTVMACEMVPGANPRRDFGDIDVLAATIEAAGGQPINPPVVARDGELWRIVDGERRWRAMKRLYGDEALVDVIAYEDMGEAECAVAMMATDEKKALTPTEAAKGFQRMLALGVDERVVAKASRRKVADVRKAAELASRAKPKEVENCTLDQMICAAEFADEEDVRAVLEADEDRWQAKAESIRRRHAAEQTREEIVFKIAGHGIEVLEKKPEGYASVRTCYNPADVDQAVEKFPDEELVAWPCAWDANKFVIGHPAKEHVESEAERAQRELDERRMAAYGELRRALARDLCDSDCYPRTQRAAGPLRGQWQGWYVSEVSDWLKDIRANDSGVTRHMPGELSCFEMLQMLKTPRQLPWHVFVATLLPEAIRDGYQPSEEDEWLLAQAQSFSAGELR